MVLILVMIIVVLISLAGFSFVAIMHNEDKATRLRGEEIQVEQLVLSGEQMVLQVLQLDPDEQAQLGGLEHNPELFRGMIVFGGESPVQRGRFSAIARRLDNGRPAGFQFGVENESSKLNINSLLEWEKQEEGAGKTALLQLPGMTDEIADAILDWMDSDNSPRGLGAEAEYYETLTPPYEPRNGPLECLEELMLVRGVRRELLFGADRNQNFVLEPEEKAAMEQGATVSATQSSEASVPWCWLLTVHSGERNVNPDGKPRIYLNDKDLRKLHRDLRQVVGRPLADFIVTYRQFGPYKGSKSVVDSSSLRVDFSRPAKAKIQSFLDLVDARIRILGSDSNKTTVVQSPLTEKRSALEEDLLQLMDYTTLTKQPVLQGRVNINLAAPQVLQAVPGIDSSVAEQIIIARRAAAASSEPRYRHPVWPALEGIVDAEKLKPVLPYLTCGGDVYRTQLVGFLDSRGPTARGEVVIDSTQSPPRRVYWKDLRVLGRGYSWEMLGSDNSDDRRNASQLSQRIRTVQSARGERMAPQSGF
jgi:type II secretory pathway component PulK